MEILSNNVKYFLTRTTNSTMHLYLDILRQNVAQEQSYYLYNHVKQCNTAPQHTAVKKNNDLSELSSEPIYRKNKEV